MIRTPGKRIALVLALCGLVATLVFAGGVASAPAEIESKRAEAQVVLDQIRQIDSALSKAVDSYNGATIRLEEIQALIEQNSRRLTVAKEAHDVAQTRLAERVVTLYVSGGDDSLFEIVLGSTSLDELLDRVDAAERVSSLDTEILGDVAKARKDYRGQAETLAAARAEQKRIVSERAAKRLEIERALGERQRLYESIGDEIERLEAEEAARQAEIAAEAERRLAATQTASTTAITTGGPTTTAVPGSRYGGVVGIAMQYLGIPYLWGGSSPSTGFDCSGFVMYVYSQVGVSLPHNAAAQYGLGVAVSRDQLQPGDLVFFDGLGHNGIYIGGGQFIHSPHTGDVVKISSLGDSWYAAAFVGAKRIL